jgi:hypothetical protein
MGGFTFPDLGVVTPKLTPEVGLKIIVIKSAISEKE